MSQLKKLVLTHVCVHRWNHRPWNKPRSAGAKSRSKTIQLVSELLIKYLMSSKTPDQEGGARCPRRPRPPWSSEGPERPIQSEMFGFQKSSRSYRLRRGAAVTMVTSSASWTRTPETSVSKHRGTTSKGGERRPGNRTSGIRTRGNRTRGNWTRGNWTRGIRTRGNRTSWCRGAFMAVVVSCFMATIKDFSVAISRKTHQLFRRCILS